MVHVKFRGMERSEVTQEVVTERISQAIERFPKGSPRHVVVTLGMENSPVKAGPDLFKVRTEIIGGKYHGLILEKSARDLYAALAQVADALLERINRFSDRLRVKALKDRRGLASKRRRASTATEDQGEAK